MCGIVGFWGEKYFSPEVGIYMIHQITSRGPDDLGIWSDSKAKIVLAHCRLSIIDLSSAGHQPMVSPDGRYVLVYNGEIYNHLDLRSELESLGGAFKWKGHSDTETLLAALCYWGVHRTLKRLNGMFAFAFWDNLKRVLYLARDRMGEKPLYYGYCGSTFLFGSQLKALMVHPDWKGEINCSALMLYLRFGYIPSPFSIYKDIYKLPPGHYVIIQNKSNIKGPICYWNLAKIAEKGVMSWNDKSIGELLDELNYLLCDSVKRQMLSDVPVGVFLSGGYDSTTITAIMQAQSSYPVKTFSIGFNERDYNEAYYAKEIAKYLGTNHTELYISPKEAMEVIPDLPEIYDEPFADSSQIPFFIICKFSSCYVKVCLSGDGGDELFYGYDRYIIASYLWKILKNIPLSLRRTIALFLYLGEKLLIKQPTFFTQKVNYLVDRLLKLSELIDCDNLGKFYYELVYPFKKLSQVINKTDEPFTIINQPEKWPFLPSFKEQMMYLDQITYLPDDILTKVDRASMAVSLEVRVPFLDYRIVEFAWKVPTRYKYRYRKGKWLLRQVLYHYVPRKLVDRPKKGFSIPLEQWLKGPLRDWVEEMLDEKQLREDGFFNSSLVRKMWIEHMLGKRRWHHNLWSILMFQAWLRKWF